MMRTATRTTGLLAFLVGGCMGGGNTHVPSTPKNPVVRASTPSAGAAGISMNQALLDELALLATSAAPSAKTRADAESVLAGRRPLTAYLDALLEGSAFSEYVVPRMIVHSTIPLTDHRALTVLSKTDSSEPIYYLRTPCSRKDAEKVHPWWDSKSEILVCPEAHQPTHTKETKSGWYCGGRNLSLKENPKSVFCGCGPNLINCARDSAQSAAAKASSVAEVEKTISYVVQKDLPFEQVFTMNGSVRDGLGDMMYQRWRMRSGEQLEFRPEIDLDAPAQLLPRKESAPGAHAGILTTILSQLSDGQRERMRDYFNVLWCESPESVNVTAEQVFALGVTDLRAGDGWRKLASMPVCTNCHARLDYGMQFFSGFPSRYIGSHFDGRLQLSGEGPLFGRNIDDKLGVAPLSPKGFAEIAVKQPAFGRCVASSVSRRVFAGLSSPEDDDAIRDVYTRTHSMRQTMRTALLRYAQAATSAPESTATTESPHKSLREQLDASCGDCHRSGARGFLSQPEFSRELLVEMASQIGYGMMPPKEPLDAPVRKELLRSIVKAAFPDATAQTEALATFNMDRLARAARDGQSINSLIHARVGMEKPSTFSEGAYIGLSPPSNYSVSLTAVIARAAVTACRHAGKTGAELQRCTKEAMEPAGIVAGVAGH